MAQDTHVIGIAKRDIKAGERIEFRIRPDGFAESDELRFRNGMAFVDLAVVAGANAPHSGAQQKTGEHLAEAQRTQSPPTRESDYLK
jgi:hypothetical protein